MVAGVNEEVRSVSGRKCGRKVLLGEELDAKVQSYIQRLRSAGTLICSSVVKAAATGIMIKLSYLSTEGTSLF